MPILNDIMGLFRRPEPDAQATAETKAVQKFFEALVKQARPWSKDEWEKAWKAYEGDAEKPKRANLWRMKVDTQGAYLDEQPPNVPVKPADGFVDDPMASARADAEEALYAYIYREMGYRGAIARARHTADVQNIGAVVHCVDMRRMMPDLKFLPTEQIAVDPDCRGSLKDANWVAWWEYVSPETLARDYEGLDLERLRTIATDTRVALEPDNERRLKEGAAEVQRVRKRCKLWRVFARNEYALYDSEPTTMAADADEEAGPHWERFRDRHGMREPRRQVLFVEGYDRPLSDTDQWDAAYALDWDEWPLHVLVHNEGEADLEGFTDYRHERRVLEYHEDALRAARQKAGLSSQLKIGGYQGCTMKGSEIRRIWSSPEVEFVPDAFTQDGRPRLAPIKFDGLSDADLAWIEALEKQHEQISGLPRIKQGGEGDYETATEAQIASESSTTLANVRLRAFERFQSDIASQTIAMAHVLLPQVSEVEIPPVPGMDGVMPPQGELVRVPASALAAVLAQEGVELVRLGVDAMVGEEKAAAWDESVPMEILRRSTVVAVERGSTQRRMRFEKVKLFAEVYERQMRPMIDKLAMVDPVMALDKEVAAARKVLELLDLEEFESLMPDMNAVMQAVAMQQQAMAQQAAMQPQEGWGQAAT